MPAPVVQTWIEKLDDDDSAASAPVGGLDLVLSSGTRAATPGDAHATPAVIALPDSDAAVVFAGVAPIVDEPGDRAQVRLLAGSQPPPKAGTVITASFAGLPGVTRPVSSASSAAPLTVVRMSPQGPVPLAPSLTVTFSQPMVAIGSPTDVAQTVPVVVSPKPAGTWRWLGPSTVTFQPDGRFPQATRYAVEVPAGTRSVTGGVLRDAIRGSFETRPPLVDATYPSGLTSRVDEPMFVRFDQRIDPVAVLAHVTVRANGTILPVELVDPGSVSRRVAKLVDEAKRDGHDGRWLVFRARGLAPHQTVDVTIGKGTPSAEGPLVTPTDQRFTWKTYPAFELDHTACTNDCWSNGGLWLSLTTPIDLQAFSPSQVEVTPPLADQKIEAINNSIHIAGTATPRGNYRVKLAGSLVDQLGQRLGHDVVRDFAIRDTDKSIDIHRGITVLDPGASRRTVGVWSINYDRVRVKIYAVTPDDYPAYVSFSKTYWGAAEYTVPGRLVSDQTIRIAGVNQLVETPIDVSPALTKGVGHAIVVVEPAPMTNRIGQVSTWVVSTSLAVDAHVDHDQLVAYASDLATGKPAANVRVELRPSGVAATTNADGVATLSLPPRSTSHPDEPRYLVSRAGLDSAITADQNALGNSSPVWVPDPTRPYLTWYVVDDRGLYRPGEQVHVKGLLRLTDGSPRGDLSGLGGSVPEVTWEAHDDPGYSLAKGRVSISAAGSFDLAFSIPTTANLGRARISFTPLGRPTNGWTHDFEIGEFRRPDYAVTTEVSPGPIVVGDAAEVTAHARYFTGSPVPDAPVTWDVSAMPTYYTPPGHDDFDFTPAHARSVRAKTWTLDARTDGTGTHTARLDLRGVDPVLPSIVTATARITDINRQEWPATAHLVVHPATRYVGLRPRATVAERGKPVDVEAIAVDVDGQFTPGASIEITASHLDLVWVQGGARETRSDVEHCTVVADARPRACTFHPAHTGRFEVVATVADDRGRINRSSVDVSIVGDTIDTTPDPSAMQEVKLVADRKHYDAGDVARIHVTTPIVPAEGIVTWQRSGIVTTQHLAMTTAATTIEVPIDPAMVPNLIVQVDLAGSLQSRPAYASGSIDLAIPPRTRALDVSVTPATAQLAPGAHTSIEVQVRDVAGKPVANAETTVIVVDEAVLSLATSSADTPIRAMYPHRSSDTSAIYARSYVLTGSAEHDLSTFDRDADGILDATDRVPDVHVRSNFDPLAVFAPAVMTDAAGTAHVDVTMPDNVTRYRVIAIAHAGEQQFGKGDSALTTRLPLMIRPSAPRFLNTGDRFELPIVVHNQTAAPMTVTLAARATNASFSGGRVRKITVAANDRVEVRLPAQPEHAGVARFQIAAVTGSSAPIRDAAEIAIPVHTPATSESFAGYGTIDAGAIAQPIAMPKNVITQVGGLDVMTSSTNLASLTDALVYVVRYPYECAEQRASRMLAVSSLAPVLAAFHDKELPPANEMIATARADLAALEALQNADGGFAYWTKGTPSDLYLSAYVGMALGSMRTWVAGASVSASSSLNSYLRDIEAQFPSTLPASARRSLSAFAVYARLQLGDRDVAKAKRLIREAGGVDRLPLEAAGWLLSTIAQVVDAPKERKALVRHIENHLVDSAGTSIVATDYGDASSLMLASEHRVDAVILQALMAERRDHDAIPRLAAGLLAHRIAGRWRSTQESAFVTSALAQYFRTYEAVTPNFVARVWLGADYAGDHAFTGRTADSHRIHVSVQDVQDVATRGGSSLTISKDGPGRLYYRIGMTYAPASLMLEPADRGFVVSRRYEAVDEPSDVRHDTSGWHVKAGSRVRAVVTMVNTRRRTHVALVDPLPAGFEVASSKDPGGRGAYWYEPWFEHQNLRDDRVEAFSQLLWEGAHELVYEVRATTPGSFVVPPPRAEEMYQPENFGRGASERVIVESG